MAEINTNKKLNKNKSSWALCSILTNKKEKRESFICWKMVGGVKQIAEVSLSIIRKSREEIVVRAVGEKNERALTDILSGSETVNFFLQEDKVLFQSKIKSYTDKGFLTVTLPKEFAHINRRNHVRLQLYDDLSSFVSFKKEAHSTQYKMNQLFEKRCFDLSAGGLSFIVSRLESRFFRNEDSIHTLDLQLNDNTIICAAKVVNILDVEPNDRNKLNYKAVQICLEFTVISKEDQKYINDYVFKYVDLDEVS